MSISPGGLSGFGANHHLPQVLVTLNMPTLQQPEAYVGHANRLFDNDGVLVREDTRVFFRLSSARFAGWIDAVSMRRAGMALAPLARQT